MRSLTLMIGLGCATLLTGCSFTTASGLTECTSSAECGENQVCSEGFCLPQPEGCGTVVGTATATSIPIGAALPLTTNSGPDESEVQGLNAIKLALDEVNQRQGVGGRNFVLHVCDTRADADRAKVQAQWLIDERKVPALFTSGSAQTLAVTSVAVPKHVVVMTHTSTSPDIAKVSDRINTQPGSPGLVWRTAPSDDLQGRVIGDLLNNKTTVADGTAPFASVSSVHVAYVDDPYGQGLFSVLFSQLGTKDTDSAKYTRNGDVTPAVNLVANTPANVAVLVGFSEDNARVISQAVTRGRTGQKWFFTDAGKDLGLFTSLGTAKPEVEGSYGTAPAQARPGDEVYRLFAQRFKSAYNNVDPGQYSFTAHGYDAMYLLALASAYAVGPDANAPQAVTGDRIAEGLARMTPPSGTSANSYYLGLTTFTEARNEMSAGNIIDVRGASGELDFDANGDAPSEYELWKIENGAFKTVQLITPATR